MKREPCASRLRSLLRGCTLLASWVRRQLEREGYSTRAIDAAVASEVVSDGRGTGARWRLLDHEERRRRSPQYHAAPHRRLNGITVLSSPWDEAPPRFAPKTPPRELNRCDCGTLIGERPPGQPRECVWCEWRRKQAS